MSMLRSLDRARRADRRRPPPLGPHRGRGDLRRAAARARRAPRRPAASHAADDRRAAADHARRPRRALPRLARARGVRLRPRRAARRADRALGRRGRLRPPAHGALPAQARLAEEGEGGTIVFAKSDTEVECDGATPILVAGEEAGLELPFGCREGICHTCIGKLCSGQVRDLRNGKITAPRARWSAPASTRPRGASRSNSEHEERHGRCRSRSESPLAHLSAEQIEELGARVRRDPRRGLRRPRRPRPPLHRRDDRDAPAARRARPRRCCCASRSSPRGWPARPRTRWPRSSRTWRSATTSCTASGTG